MKTPVLVIIKPEGLIRGIAGIIVSRFAEAGLDMAGCRLLRVPRELAEEHYQHLKGQPFYRGVIDHLTGKIHGDNKVLVIVFYGTNAVLRGRKIAGATNPEEAEPTSIRGAFGRITTRGVYENIIHVSSDDQEAEREIKLWLRPEDILIDLYPTKEILNSTEKKREWA